MAIAPSKLGRLVWDNRGSDDVLVRRLRDAELVRPDASDEELTETFVRAREEDAALASSERPWNSPEERVRVFLAPYLTAKGHAWAVPLKSLDLFDEADDLLQPLTQPESDDRRGSMVPLKTIAFGIGLCIAVVGVIGALVPAELVWIATHSTSSRVFIVVGAVRIVFGGLLISVSPASRAPQKLRGLGTSSCSPGSARS